MPAFSLTGRVKPGNFQAAILKKPQLDGSQGSGVQLLRTDELCEPREMVEEERELDL